jgi:hypothetical protein
VDLLKLAAEGRSAAAPTAPAGAAAERPGNTLTTQWPDLAEAYAEELQVLTVAQLRALAQRRGISLSGTKREPIIETLSNALGSVPAMFQVWETLSPAARLVAGLAPFVESDYGANPVHVRQALQAVDSKLAAKADAAIQELRDAGVLFLNDAHHLSGAGTMSFFFPPDSGLLGPAEERGLTEALAAPPLVFGQLSLRLLLALKAEGAHFTGRPAVPAHPLAAQAPELRGWPVVAAELEKLGPARNVYQAFNQQALTVPPAPSLLADESSERLAQTLAVAPAQADFVLRLLVKLGVVGWLPGEPVTVREEGFQQYLALTPLQHVAPLFNAYATLNDWTELGLAVAAVPGLALKRQVRYGLTYPAVLSAMQVARFYFLQLLRRAPAGQWTRLDQLVVRARALNVLHAFWPLPAGLYLELNGRSLAQDTAENWRAFYRPFIEALLAGPLHWLGLVDLGYRKGVLDAVRITDFGALALYQTQTYSPPVSAGTGPALQIAADGSLLISPSGASPQLLNTLSLLGAARANADGLLCYTVTPAGAVRAFQAGWDAEQLLETLSGAAGQPVPAGLAGALRQWWAHFGEVQLYPDVALLELADDFALAELLSSTSLAQYLLYRFSPRVVALRPEGVEALRAELVSRGYTPRVAA